MATYKEIKGTQIEVLASDPSNPVEGQVWFNSTSNVLKGEAATAAGSWATGGTLNTGRESGGSQNIGSAPHSALVAGNGGPPASGITELYNGSAWTEVNNLNTVRYGAAGSGTTTAGLAFGGENYPSSPPYQAATETWNGTNWTEVNDLNTARYALCGGGTNTSAVCGGGEFPSYQTTPLAETWNGSNWTEVNDLNTARYALCGGGTNTSAVCGGGEFPSYQTTPLAETWNGSNWTEVANPNQARRYAAMAAVSSTSALMFGGLNPASSPTIFALTELWNGSAWTEVNDLTTARYGAGGTGTITAALAFGGDTPPNTGKTEEYNGTNWTETTDMSTATKYMFGSGTTASALSAGGSGSLTRTEEWTGAGPVTRTFTDS
tara:strand:- start:6 stop:1139 length:1134 start_codon:yes stop_codon:yes gene_type:complete